MRGAAGRSGRRDGPRAPDGRTTADQADRGTPQATGGSLPIVRMRVTAALPDAAKGTPFGARIHAIATYLKTFQALSYERLQGAFADLFGLTISQGGLINMLRRAQAHFAGGRDDAVSEQRQAGVVSSD